MKYTLKEKIPHDNCLVNLLTARGISPADIQDYLKPTENLLYSWQLMDNMAVGAQTLLNHIKNKSNIFIQVDSDVDGFTSAAIMYLYIKKIDPEANVNWRVHEGKQHGIILDKIPDATDLLIVPDAGSNDYEQHAALKELGMGILVLDHHIADKESEYAIIINNQLSERYPNKTLCGAGVVLKFCQCLDDTLKVKYSEEFYDLAAVGLISDMMDLRDLETRYIVHKGLHSIKNLGLKAFIEKQAYSIGNQLTPTSIAFYIAPLVNAIVRVGTQEEKEILFTAFIDGGRPMQSKKRGAKAGDIELAGDQAARIATNARNKQNKEKERAMDLIRGKIDAEGLDDNAIILVGLDESDFDFDSNLTGLIAMQLMKVYNKPVLLTRLSSDGYYRGSARGDSNWELDNFKGFLEESGMFEYTAGHANAFGLSLAEDKVEKFLSYSNKYVQDNQIDFSESAYYVDFIYDYSEDMKEDIMDLGRGAELWGSGLQEPLIVIEDIPLSQVNITVMGASKDTVKLILPNGLACIKFKSPDFIQELEQDGNITVIGRANLNEWCGTITPQLFITDYKIVNTRLLF